MLGFRPCEQDAHFQANQLQEGFMNAKVTPLIILKIGLVIAWSSGFVGARLASDSAPVFLVLLWRFVIVGLVLLPITFLHFRRTHDQSRPVGPTLCLHAILGALAMFGFLALAVKAVDLGVPAGLVALVAALQPLATAVCAGPILGEHVTGRQLFGLLLGFSGVAVAVGATFGSAPWWAYLLPVLAMISLAAATLIAKRNGDDTPLIPAIGAQCIVAALLFLPMAAVEGSIAPTSDLGFIASVAWFIVFSTIGGYGFYWGCLRRSTATHVASLIYLTPPVTMLWALAMFGDPLTAGGIIGFLLCLVGVYLARDHRVLKLHRQHQSS